MLITIDTDLLIKSKLDANQFTILTLIYENEIDLLNKYLKEINQYDKFAKEDLNELMKMGYIYGIKEEMYDFKHLELSNKFIKLVSRGDIFEELVRHYPKSVVRPDGKVDYLLTDLSSAKNIYTKLTNKNIALHDFIIICLEEEIEDRTENDTMKYMKRLPKWISDRGWESYKERMRDLQPVNGDLHYGYGTRIQ
jgi:hypothetical protein